MLDVLAECKRRGYTRQQTLAVLTLAIDERWAAVPPGFPFDQLDTLQHPTIDHWYNLAQLRGQPAFLWQAYKARLYVHIHEAEDIYDNPTGESPMTENGWPACGQDQLERNPIPGTNVVIGLQRGIPNRIMKAFAADFNAFVEALRQADTGGWTATNSVATSNHLGGTAMDLRWNDHPMGNANAGYSTAEIATIREMLAFYEGMIFWGNDWNSPKDGMHFQMGYNTFNNQAKCNDFINRKVKADGFSTFRRGAAPADPNAFPLPPGYCYGPLDGPEYSISGDFDGDLQSWKDGLGRWQATLGVPVTKRWDDATKAAATTLQKAKGWPSNPDFGYGGVYQGEWDAVIKQGWRLPGAPPPALKPVVVGPADDQLNMRWNCIGGQTLLEAVAELRDHLLGKNDKDKTGVVVK